MPEDRKYENKPYKGHLSYQLEDGAFFFGRARQADQLVAKILASPATLVHARSGAGKTSILNASVIPGLEERGWTVALARPHFNASESLRTAAVRQILPPPAAEADALEAAHELLFPDREDVALQEILDRFDLLEPRNAGRRELLQPREPAAGTPGGSQELVRPLFFRLLRATLEIKQYGEHIEALLGSDGAGGRAGTLESRVSAGALGELLRQGRLADGRSGLAEGILREGPTLRSFVEQLFQRYGRRRKGFGLVLILDQFEEMFTRFTADPGTSAGTGAPQPTWKLRLEFFDELQELYEATARVPVHIVLSMRDEYVAQLDPLRRFIRDLDAASYHLTFLERDEAQAAIREPARIFGYDYDEEVYADIFAALVQEDRFIEPSQLQIVCEKLWEVAGRQVARSERGLSAEPALIHASALPSGGARQILKSFFSEYLQELDAADRAGSSRLEALEILDTLVVAETGTRNVVEKKVLENAPFRDPGRRAALLQSLAEKRIIRLEPRLGGEFAEITHEFLIPSIRDHINVELNGNTDYANLRWALRALTRFKDVDIREGTGNLLPRPVFAILNRERHKLFLGTSPLEQIVPELMLRSALALGAGREDLDYWMKEVARHELDMTPEDILCEERIKDPSRRFMSLCELAVIMRQPPRGKLSAGQCAFVLRNLLARATAAERDCVVFWTRQVRDA